MAKIKTEYGYKSVWSNGDTFHYNHKGKRHNPNGPAIHRADGYKAYYINGVRHRTDGPAIICDHFELHFINGKYAWKR